MTDTPITLETLLYLYEGEVLRDVEMAGGESAHVAILDGPEDLLASWGGGITSLYPSGLLTFTTDDRTTRYTCEGVTWTAVTLDGDA